MCDEAPRHVFNSICRYVNQVYTSLQSLCSYYALPRQSNLRVILRNPSAFLHARYIFLLILLPPISPQIFPIFSFSSSISKHVFARKAFSFMNRIQEGGRKSSRKRPANVQGCSSFVPSEKIRTPREMDFRGKKRRPPSIRLGWPRNFKVFHECVSPRGESYTEVNSTNGGGGGDGDGGDQALHSRRVCALLLFSPPLLLLLFFFFSFFFEPPIFATRAPFARPLPFPLPDEKCARVFNFSARQHSKKIFKFHVKRCGH